MCGIAGFIGKTENWKDEIKGMCNRIAQSRLCNFVQFGLATMSIFVLQLWVILFYNKQSCRDGAPKPFLFS